MVRRKVRTFIQEMAVTGAIMDLGPEAIKWQKNNYDNACARFIEEKTSKGWLHLGTRTDDYPHPMRDYHVYYSKLSFVYIGKKRVHNEGFCTSLKYIWNAEKPDVLRWA